VEEELREDHQNTHVKQYNSTGQARCIDDTNWTTKDKLKYLTKDKIYEVSHHFDGDYSFITIRDDSGKKENFNRKRFEMIL